ncbi:hypothetical protein F2Q69_00054719 [Brassica cretica]|uniref:Uncharacterized protein n=1 Tax=Brassica cretica TaxID=69181 RepID=A0A8S9N0M5_BRACR|nr:hypothetical protein F2Q69_00054719 [Brassica cretica]
MDLGQPRLRLVDVDGSGGTVEETFNCWGQEILIDGNQLCIRREHASTLNLPELLDRLQGAYSNDKGSSCLA